MTNTVVNVTRVTNIYNQRNVTNITYVNQRVNNGVTVVSRDTFINARPVERNLARVDARQLAQAQVVRQVSVQPVRASVLGSGAPARFRPPQAVINRQVVATQRPMPPKSLSSSGKLRSICVTEQPNPASSTVVNQEALHRGRWRGRKTPARVRQRRRGTNRAFRNAAT